MPLIGLGLVDTMDEVYELMDEFDDDGSHEIEFDEFLKIIVSLKHHKYTAEAAAGSSSPQSKSSLIKNFFSDFTLGHFDTKGLQF